MQRTKLLALLLAILTFDLAFAASLHASGKAGRDRLEMHKKRWEYEQVQEEQKNREWTAPEVEINVQARVPVVDTIGYLAMNYDEPERLNRIIAQLRPIAKQVRELSGGEFRGETFPADVEVQLDKLRRQMMADVTTIYGSRVTQQLEAFLKQKYDSLADDGSFF